MVIFQETDIPVVHRKTVAEFLEDGIRGRAEFVIAENVILFSQVNASGVHLHANLESFAAVRETVGPTSLIGFTPQTLEEAAEAQLLGADYLLVCIDWSAPEVALKVLSKYVEATAVPIIAGADVPIEHVRSCMDTGATGVAVISRAMVGEHGAKEMQLYRNALDTQFNTQSRGKVNG